MKKIFKMLAFVFLVSVSTLSSFAYELTDKDYEIVDKIDEKVFTIINKRGEDFAPKIVDLLVNYADNKIKSERIQEIVYAVADDVEYEYYLGEYEEVELEDDFLDEGFKGVEKDSASEDYEAVYSIEGNTLSLEQGEKSEKHTEIFEIYTTLIPKSVREKIIRFKVYTKNDGDTFAYVDQDEQDQSEWNLVVNTALFYKGGELDMEESIHTLIHELFHTTSLSAIQMNHGDYEVCEDYELQEGCLNSKSYLNQFITQYWKKNFEASQNPDHNDFYLEDESAYVTDYAATNPGEDIAESFTYFILQSKPSSSHKISDKKILFFYKFKELVKLRNEMRKGIKELKK